MIRETPISENGIELIFPIPIYRTSRESNLDSTEKKEIEDIIKEGMDENHGNSTTNNSYIFNTKLKKLKEFCEQHLENFAEHFINPKEEMNFYITQSWLNITKPGGFHHEHNHPNSIMSGVFYVSTVEDDKITFNDPNIKIKELVHFEPKELTSFNTKHWSIGVNTLDLLIFPSWLQHSVRPNDKQSLSMINSNTTDRISISFNTFMRGTIGDKNSLTELFL